MSVSELLPPLLGGVGLWVAYKLYQDVLKWPAGEGKVQEIGNAIHEGAMVFLKREYRMLAMFSAVVVVFLFFTLGFGTAFAFVVGALASASAGLIGMYSATKANVRTTTAAHEKGWRRH